MEIYERNLHKIQKIQQDIKKICLEEQELFALCQRVNSKKPIKCENGLKALILCFQNKGGLLINYD